MRRISILLVLAMSGAMAFAQTAEKPKETVFDRFPDALGFYADGGGIIGLCYQHWSRPFGFEAAMSVTASQAGGVSAAAIVEGRYRLYAEDWADWLSGSLYVAALGGAGLQTVQLVVGDTTPRGPFSVIAGAGIGIEAALFGHFAVDFQFLYRAVVWSNDLGIGLCPGFGLIYRF